MGIYEDVFLEGESDESRSGVECRFAQTLASSQMYSDPTRAEQNLETATNQCVIYLINEK